jgi:hypothetical protein
MAYDQELADRIRDLLPDGVEVTEKPMFGGLAFLVGGHLAVSASGRGGLMVRVDPAESERLVTAPGTTRREMSERARTEPAKAEREARRLRRLGSDPSSRGAERAVSKPGREMDGWLRVTSEAVTDDAALAQWVLIGTDYAGSLPPK